MPLIKPDGKKVPEIPKYESQGRVLDNWLIDYLKYTSDNEAPPIFHQWIGLATIAGAAQRKIFMETEYFPVHTNMFIVLVGPPGAKKSTAIRQGKKILRKVPNVHFTTSATSVTGLIQQFTAIPQKDHQSLTAMSDELGSFFGISKTDMVDFLIDIFDGEPDWDKQTAVHGKEKIPFPWLNLMAGTTPTWLGDNLSRTAIEGGFVSRSIFIYDDELILKSPFPEKTNAQQVLREKLANDLSHISTLNGEFTFDKEAKEFYNAWYLDRARFPVLRDNRTAGYYARKHVHVLKVAMALSLAESDSLVLTERDIRTALTMLEDVESRMKQAFATVGGNITVSDMTRISSQIHASGGMAFGEILNANLFSIRRETIESILADLVDMGEVTRTIVPGKKTVYYPADKEGEAQ